MRRAHVVAVVLGVLTFAGLARGDQPTTRPDDIVRGQELYDRHCVQCHGALNDGKGPAAASLVVPIPDLQSKFEIDDLDALVPVILDGRGAMPSFVNSFDKYDARRVLKHMAGLNPESARYFEKPEKTDGEGPVDEEGGPDENGPEENVPEAGGPEE